MIIDKLIDRILELQNPTVVGLDPQMDIDKILDFNKGIIDAIYDIVPAVKPQIAFYELFGSEGILAYNKTIEYAKMRGMIVIADIKRGDIASTAEAYAKAHLGGIGADFATINPYLGKDSLEPFVKLCKENDKGIFVLVKTSNPGSADIQNLESNGRFVYEIVGDYVAEMGRELIGKHGFSSIGAVVGATHPAELINLRKQLPSTFFLIPGYGAQGGRAEDIAQAFKPKGIGAIVNSSRGIIEAYKTEKYRGLKFDEAARLAALDMREKLCEVL